MSLKSYLFAAVAVLGLAAPVMAAEGFQKEEPKEVEWPHIGFTGTYDRASLQRGFQVYKEVCSACHSLKRVALRSLTEIGFSEAEVKAIAKSYTVQDGPNDQGEMFDRPGLPSDHFPGPYANDQAARAAQNGALPPDQSLLVKSREGHENYIYSILTGYGHQPPAELKIEEGKYFNPYMNGGIIAMAPPLSDGAVTYADGTKATVEQMAKDVTQFLAWAGEPNLEARHRMGFKVLLFMAFLTILTWFVNKRVWAGVKKA